jgi:hypothetical protein
LAVVRDVLCEYLAFCFVFFIFRFWFVGYRIVEIFY